MKVETKEINVSVIADVMMSDFGVGRSSFTSFCLCLRE